MLRETTEKSPTALTRQLELGVVAIGLSVIVSMSSLSPLDHDDIHRLCSASLRVKVRQTKTVAANLGMSTERQRYFLCD